MKKAIVLGGSGLIGSALLQLLLGDNRYGEIVSIGRKELDMQHPKLKQRTGDLFQMESFLAEFQDGDDLFIAIGTTKAKTPNRDLYEKIDLGIPLTAARLAKETGMKHVAIVSAANAKEKSNIWYSAMKGRMENKIKALGLNHVVFARPSLLLGNRQENRAGERLATFVITKLDFLIPKKQKAIPAKTVAISMIVLCNAPFKKAIWTNDELFELAHSNPA